MFQIVLFSVIAYLAACYGYGLFLLVKLYMSRRSMAGGAATVPPVAGTLLHPAAGEPLEHRRAA